MGAATTVAMFKRVNILQTCSLHERFWNQLKSLPLAGRDKNLLV